jgi:hypothetical protein
MFDENAICSEQMKLLLPPLYFLLSFFFLLIFVLLRSHFLSLSYHPLSAFFWLHYDSSPFISSPFILSRSFCTLVISYPVISSPGHLVPWSFCPLLSQHPIQFHMYKIIQFRMCKIILKMWYVVTTCHTMSHLSYNRKPAITSAECVYGILHFEEISLSLSRHELL